MTSRLGPSKLSQEETSVQETQKSPRSGSSDLGFSFPGKVEEDDFLSSIRSPPPETISKNKNIFKKKIKKIFFKKEYLKKN